MGAALGGGQTWNAGYRIISIIQVVLTAILIFSLPLWKKRTAVPEAIKTSEIAIPDAGDSSASSRNGRGEEGSSSAGTAGTVPTATTATSKPLTLRQIFAIPGVKAVMVTFFCYCTVETTTGLWASSYLYLHAGISKTEAASFAALFYIGITVGRAASGFATMKLNDTQMTRIGEVIIGIGILTLFLPNSTAFAPAGFILVGLGCAPIYPSIIHATPVNFGADRSQAIIGVQMAFAYIGSMAMPPVFGLIANNISITLLPVFLTVATIVMAVAHESLLKQTSEREMRFL